MKKLFYGILIWSFIFYSGCSSAGEKDERKVIAHVNNYKMTVEDLKYELKNIPHDEISLLKTEKGRKDFLDRLIEKEILLQEAQREGIDKESAFRKSIESYWEQALLKILLQRKAKEISGSVYVYDNEVEDYYIRSEEKSSLSRVSGEIRRAIRERKEQEVMNAWIENLKKKSHIRINEELLKEAFSNN